MNERVEKVSKNKVLIPTVDNCKLPDNKKGERRSKREKPHKGAGGGEPHQGPQGGAPTTKQKQAK